MKKILVIQTASIGDVILATALLEKLHHFYPEASLDFLVKKGMEPLFYRHPFIHRVLVWDKSNKYKNLHDLIHEVRRSKYDVVINVQRFALTGLLTLFSGAKRTIGFDKNPFSLLFTKRVPHEIGPGIHEIRRNQKLIEDLTDEQAEKPRLYPGQMPDPGSRKPDPILSSGIGHPPSGTYYTISPASLWFTKQYPAERWAELIGQMSDESTIYLLGSKSDFELCEEIIRLVFTPKSPFAALRSQGDLLPPIASVAKQQGRAGEGFPSIVNLAGQLSLLESAALMKGAQMNFTNDSAPMHLASAVNAPVTVVYCSTTPDFGFGPLSDNRTIVEVQSELSCRPCGLHGLNKCPKNHFRCAFDINLEHLRSRL